MEFHIARQARDLYKFDESIFTLNGNVIFVNFHTARLFTQKMNQIRDLVNFPENAVKTGQVNAMGLIDEILHFVIKLYQETTNPDIMQKAYESLKAEVGEQAVYTALHRFVTDFPPVKVYQEEITVENYLRDNTDGVPNEVIEFEEMLMLWIANKNHAHLPFLELFDHTNLVSGTDYPIIIKSLHNYFENQSPFGPKNQNLIDMLRSPAIAHPDSLLDQLEFIRTQWASLLGTYLYRLLSSMDLIQEEQKSGFMGSGPIPIPVYGTYGIGPGNEPERFSRDQDWMPRLVLMAKNSFVWLDQLSKKYQRPIHRLDQIPDEELEILARWGFTGLWLIGLWERSSASARIKQLCGNPEAIASAYSLTSYQIAEALGGEEAYEGLRQRCWQRGIRLASDMVPNHMAIDSKWVMEHPEWFVQLPYSPFPSYNFEGPNLSQDDRASIYLDNHYYNRSDAAVVFKRVSNHSGETQFIYHGNDGTSMPWNDTAQLNYLLPEVREQVIQTIIDVARKFPIIRFDAAMTLTKRHYQRLWFPEPGQGGDIPTRAGLGLTKDQFNDLIPEEFWREVVDRVAQEAPDTLLLAEAFWLMEGYFVRTLGMHRVYNSAFMNLLRDEDNAKYRQIMKNTLEFEPEILKRFVNFMNNPDEKSAVEQFGNGDKYFGICILMATLPGLPMFGHGQIEGFSEKYGMEYKKAYWDEKPDPYLINRHEREIFPLLHRRTLFAGVENFVLYDFYNPDGKVNENVIAYSNQQANEKSLVIYNNKFADTSGWVRTSVGFAIKDSSEGQKIISQRNLSDGLDILSDDNSFIIFRDHITGLEYIHPSNRISEEGLFFELHAYQSCVLLDFRQIADDESQSYRRIYEHLNGRGVPSIREALKSLLMQKVQLPFQEICNPGYFDYLTHLATSPDDQPVAAELFTESRQKMHRLLEGIASLTGYANNYSEILAETEAKLRLILSLELNGKSIADLLPEQTRSPNTPRQKFMISNPNLWLILWGWLFTHSIGKMTGKENYEVQSIAWFEEWKLGNILETTYKNTGLTEETAHQLVNLVHLSLGLHRWFSRRENIPQLINSWLSDHHLRDFLKVNRYHDVLWFQKEAFIELSGWLYTLSIIQILYQDQDDFEKISGEIIILDGIISKFIRAAENSGYQIDNLIDNIGKTGEKLV